MLSPKTSSKDIFNTERKYRVRVLAAAGTKRYPKIDSVFGRFDGVRIMRNCDE